MYEIIDSFYIFDDYKLNKINAKLKGNFDIDNIDPIKMKFSNFGYDGQRIYDPSLRKSKTYQEKINLKLKTILSKFEFSDEFEYIEYEEEGYFEKHVDRKRTDTHTHTVLIYPPQDIEGGELNLYPFDDEYKIVIKPSTKWTGIMFPINILHESTIIKQGKKKLLKTIASKI